MNDKTRKDAFREQNMTDVLKNWMMVALTVVFVVLYAAALIGWLKPLTDTAMITRLEPIIFVIIGYYFGRLPAQQNEKTLKDEINRQSQKADAAQHVKEQAQQQRETLEEKIRNVKATLVASLPHSSQKSSSEADFSAEAVHNSHLQNSVIAVAVNILDS